VIDISIKAKFELWEKEVRAAKTATAVFCAWQPQERLKLITLNHAANLEGGPLVTY
jgi:hypothetical protein